VPALSSPFQRTAYHALQRLRSSQLIAPKGGCPQMRRLLALICACSALADAATLNAAADTFARALPGHAFHCGGPAAIDSSGVSFASLKSAGLWAGVRLLRVPSLPHCVAYEVHHMWHAGTRCIDAAAACRRRRQLPRLRQRAGRPRLQALGHRVQRAGHAAHHRCCLRGQQRRCRGAHWRRCVLGSASGSVAAARSKAATDHSSPVHCLHSLSCKLRRLV